MLFSVKPAQLLLSFCLGGLVTFILIKPASFFNHSPAHSVCANEVSQASLKLDFVTAIQLPTEQPATKSEKIEPSCSYVEQEEVDVLSLFELIKSIFSMADLLPYDDSDFLQLIANNSLVSEEELMAFENPAKFAQRYFEISNQNFYESYEQDDELLNSWFSSSYLSPFSETHFKKDAGTIYLYIEISDFVAQDVLVKWYNADTGERILFKRFSVNSKVAREYFWVRKDHWEEGTYNAEIFSADESLKLLAVNQFLVY